MGKSEAYELEGILHDVADRGFAAVPLRKLLRLLEKGNRAAGTWRALLDAWEEIGQERNSLNIAELPAQVILLTTNATQTARSWADE